MTAYTLDTPGAEVRAGEVTQADIDLADSTRAGQEGLDGVVAKISCVCPVYQALARILGPGQVDAVGFSVYEQGKDTFDIEAASGSAVANRVARWDRGRGMEPFPFRYAVKA